MARRPRASDTQQYAGWEQDSHWKKKWRRNDSRVEPFQLRFFLSVLFKLKATLTILLGGRAPTRVLYALSEEKKLNKNSHFASDRRKICSAVADFIDVGNILGKSWVSLYQMEDPEQFMNYSRRQETHFILWQVDWSCPITPLTSPNPYRYLPTFPASKLEALLKLF